MFIYTAQDIFGLVVLAFIVCAFAVALLIEAGQRIWRRILRRVEGPKAGEGGKP
jgi:hypothetical protein